MTSTTIKIGVGISSDAAEAFNQFSGSSANFGDWKAYTEAVVKYVNAHGGLAGRKVVPVYYDFQYTKGASEAAREREACTKWTQDEKVFAALLQLDTQGLAECLADKQVISLQTSFYSHDEQDFKAWPNYLYFPSGMNLTRETRIQVDELHRGGYFSKGAKIGVVYTNTAGGRRAIQNGLKPQLAKYGLSVADEVGTTPPDNPDAAGSESAQVQTAVVKFNSQGIDHVLFAANYGLDSLLFTAGAKGQEYYPKYGATSNSPAASVDPAALKGGAMFVGWRPFTDTLPAYRQGEAFAAEKLCFDIMKKERAAVPNQTAGWRALSFCENFFFLKHGLDRAAAINAEGFRKALETQEEFGSAVTYKARIRPDRHDGASAVRLLRWIPQCECYRYTSAPLHDV